MIRYLKRFSVVCVLGLATGAEAAVTSFTPNPANLNDLDHHMVYAWRIDNVDPTNASITSAQISIKSIANWDSSPNILYMHLLDTAKQSGVSSFVDDPSTQTPVPVSQMIDDFANPRYHAQSNWLVAAGTADTYLASKSFTTTPTDYTYTFTADQLKALNAYVTNGHNIALGFDPDCHFYNDGIKFTITTAAVPEPTAVALLGIGLGGALVSRRRMRLRAIADAAA